MATDQLQLNFSLHNYVTMINLKSVTRVGPYTFRELLLLGLLVA